MCLLLYSVSSELKAAHHSRTIHTGSSELVYGLRIQP